MLYSKFLNTMKKYGIDRLISECSAVIVGFSGGADSTLLVNFMNQYCKERDIKICAAHLNHMIRGSEADNDEKLSEEYCKSIGVEFYSKRYNVPEFAEKNKLGLEEAARIIRYEYFDEIAHAISSEPDKVLIATAHNANDNMETVLMNILRGSGIKGLGGIDPVRDKRYIRPIIELSSDEIRDYLKSKSITYAIDSTNSDNSYRRNYIRNVLLPVITKEYPECIQSFLRLSENARTDSDYLSMEADRVIETKDIANRELLSNLHPAVKSRVLTKLFNLTRKDNTSEHLEKVHIDAISNLLMSENTHGKVSLPCNILFFVDRNKCGFTDTTTNYSENNIEFCFGKDGEVFENELYKIVITNNSKKIEKNQNIYKLSIHKELKFDKIKGVIFIRYKREGDSYRYGNMTRKVRRLFIDKKMSEMEKSLTPIICDDNGIIYIPGFGVRDGLEGDGDKLHIYVYNKREDNYRAE